MDRPNTPSKGVMHARTLIRTAEVMVERRAQPSDLKTSVLELLREAQHHMRRNISKLPSRRISRRMDRDLVQSIMLAVIANPNASRKEIGDLFGVQAGRVTEVVQGKHDKLLSRELREAFDRARGSQTEVEIRQLPLTVPRSAA